MFRKSFLQVIALFLPIAFGVVGIGIYAFQSEKSKEFIITATNESSVVEMGRGAIEENLEKVVSDLLFLSQYHAFKAFIDTFRSSTQSEIGEDFKRMMERRHVYDQLRWIDESGMERLRINYNGGRSSIVPEEHLQNKKNRYYFSHAMKLSPHEIYFSPFDLNIEKNKVEIPYKPTIRIATPVVDSAGDKRGIFIINYLGDDVIRKFTEITAMSRGSSMLLNSDGYWIKGVDPADEWGFILNHNDLTMAHRHPFAWNRILKEEHGQFENEEGLWTFTTVYPLPSRSLSPNRPYFWKAVTYIPAEKLYAHSNILLYTFLVIGALALVLSGVGSWALIYQYEKKKQVISALQELHRKTEGILRSVPDMIVQVDNDKRYTWVNREGRAFFGEDVIGKEASFYFEGEQNTYDSVNPLLTGDSDAVYIESWQRRCDREKRLLGWWCQALKDEEGKIIGILSTARDITEQKLSKEALEASEKKYKGLVENAMVGIYRMDFSGKVLYVNGALAQILGYDSPEELIGKNSASRYKEPKQGAEFMQRLLKEEHVGNYEIELLDKHSATVPVMISGMVDGDIFSGMIMDMREIKHSRQEIEKLSKAIEQIDDAVVMTNKEGVVTYVNAAFSEHTGYTADEILGKTPRIFKSGEHSKEFYQELWEIILSGKVYRGTFINRKKNGDLYYENKTITPLRDDKNSIVGFVWTGKDVTQETLLHREIERIATIDNLTGIYNRHKFEELFALEAERSRRFSSSLSLILIDIDHFKSVNDTYGHNAGDEVLKYLTEIVEKNIRKIDIFARWGGEEFLILSPGTGIDDIQLLAEKLRLAVECATFAEVGNITISLGASTFKKEDTFSELFKRVDKGLYYAKEHGRNQVGVVES
ncbi:MAG: diguanylate cyclase [Sulfuricurvum sp.]|nr:diguanylate cyclase [Sulfuricurvum sp.]